MQTGSVPTVVIFRSHYGQLSETFVRDHVQGLSGFHPLVLTNKIDRYDLAKSTDTVMIRNDGLWSKRSWLKGRHTKVHSLLEERKPALIHAHFLMDGASILPYAKDHNIPLLVTAHGYDATTWPQFQARSEEGRLLLKRQEALASYATLILCVSDFIRYELIARGYPGDRLITHPLGVNTTALVPRNVQQKRGIISVGRLVEKKGTQFLIEAYAELSPALRAEHPLTIIGDGPLRGALERLANKLGVSPLFLGASSREEVMAALEGSALFCLPSIRAKSGDAEGMPIAIMEALALAVPVVVFDGQAAGSLILESGAGLVARAADSLDLSKALCTLLENPSVANEMGLRGRRVIEEKFDLVKNNTKLCELYNSVIRIG